MTAQAVSGRSGDQLLGRQAAQVVCVVLTATFVVYADLSVVNIAAPAIERQLRASVADLELMVAGYQITYAAALLQPQVVATIQVALPPQRRAGGVAAAATAGQLRSGMTYSLLYNPVTFGISAIIIITSFRPRRRQGALTGAGADVRDAGSPPRVIPELSRTNRTGRS